MAFHEIVQSLVWSPAGISTRAATVFIFGSYYAWVFIVVHPSPSIFSLLLSLCNLSLPSAFHSTAFYHHPTVLCPFPHFSFNFLLSPPSSHWSVVSLSPEAIQVPEGVSPCHWFPASPALWAPHPTVLTYGGFNSIMFLRHTHSSWLFWLISQPPHGILAGAKHLAEVLTLF